MYHYTYRFYKLKIIPNLKTNCGSIGHQSKHKNNLNTFSNLSLKYLEKQLPNINENFH